MVWRIVATLLTAKKQIEQREKNEEKRKKVEKAKR